MKNHEKSRKIMKSQEKSKKIKGNKKIMKNHEKSWKIMKNQENWEKSGKIRKNQERSKEIKKSVKIRKNQDKSRKLRKIFCMWGGCKFLLPFRISPSTVSLVLLKKSTENGIFTLFSTHVRFFENYVRPRVRIDSKLLSSCL